MVGRMTLNDVDCHAKTPAHVTNFKSTTSTPTVTTMFAAVEDPLTKQVTLAEILLTAFVTEHELAFNIADHFTQFLPVMFPDSKIAKKFSCRRQKTANIINQSMGPEFNSKVTKLCRREEFTIMIDENNDKGCDKCVAILVRVHDESVKRISTDFLAMPICNIGTGENLFNCLQSVLVEKQIPWKNVIGYTSDNANVMIGQHNSVLSRLREKQPTVYDLGCVCHLANTCLSYALKKLPPGVEDLLIDTFYYFKHSSKRKEEYKEFIEFVEIEDPCKILKHCPTRWLFLQKCVKRTLQHWPALRSYFCSQPDAEKKGTRVQLCATRLQDDHLYLTYLFLDYILVPLMEFNTTFQADEPSPRDEPLFHEI